MTKERSEEVVLVAVILSLAIHAGLMYYARSRVMTKVANPGDVHRPVPVRITETETRPEAPKVEEILEEDAQKAAPEAERVTAAPAQENETAAIQVPEIPPEALAIKAPEVVEAKPIFAAETLKLDGEAKREAMPVTVFTAPHSDASVLPSGPAVAAAAVPAMPEVSFAIPDAPKEDTAVKFTAQRPKVDFTPSAEVYAEVEQKVVEAEKAAVADLMAAENAFDLTKAVSMKLEGASDDQWNYFRVTVSPKLGVLKNVPKDVVVLLDASGSIGRDRMGSIRGAAKKMLRSVTNTGDRFNLVAFRDRYSYAFKRWQEVSENSLAASDKWLNNQAPHGRTDVFSTISSVLTLPRDPKRPLIALVITDGEANEGVSGTKAILSQFSDLNGGLISIYMYGVKESANRELLDTLSHLNRGESHIFEGMRWSAGEGIEPLTVKFRDPLLSDLKLVFAADSKAETYPKYLKNLYRGESVVFTGRLPKTAKELAFSLSGLNGANAWEGYFRFKLAEAAFVPAVKKGFQFEYSLTR